MHVFTIMKSSMKNMSHYTYIDIRIDFHHFVLKIMLWNTIVK